ncbi:hypothetical protein QYF61_005116 [Mycteria americana]|uniref:Uncharacterized protein n=1 Tax=Mycteria americana TaxID=33587 RepID=A0AAN7NG85_MYCAM|nr:hypothetical protein QYF61_005116 [Mycteria americana]
MLQYHNPLQPDGRNYSMQGRAAEDKEQLEIEIGNPVDNVEEQEGGGEEDARVGVQAGDVNANPPLPPHSCLTVLNAAEEPLAFLSFQARGARVFILLLLYLWGPVHDVVDVDGGAQTQHTEWSEDLMNTVVECSVLHESCKDEDEAHRDKEVHGCDIGNTGKGHLQLDQVAQSPIQPDLECFQGWGIYHLSGQPVPVLHHPHLLKGCNKDSPESSLLQAEQHQLFQPFLIGEVFHPSSHFCGPPLDPLQQVHVFLVLRTPELDAELQDMVGFLGCKRTLPAHVQLFIHQYPQVPLHRVALDHIIPQPVLVSGVALTQVQELALGLVEPHEVHMGPLLKLVQVSLGGILSLRHVNHTTQLGVVSKLAEGALNPTVYIIDEDIKQYWSPL